MQTFHDKREDTLRRTGRTTRLVDIYIQDLFTKNECRCLDHYQYGSHREANLNLMRRVTKRLEFEHGLLPGIHFAVNVQKFEIRLKPVNLSSKT